MPANFGNQISQVHRTILNPQGTIAPVGKGEGIPLPPRCRDRVNTLYLPACGFPAPGDPCSLALNEGTPAYSMSVDRAGTPNPTG